MRITFVLESADLAGGVRVVAEYAQRLMSRGHDVEVVSTPNPELPFRLKLSHLRKHRRWPSVSAIGASHLDGTGVRHRRIEKYRPIRGSDLRDGDVVIATTWRTGHWVAKMPESKGIKVHLMQHYETWAGWNAAEGCPAAWRLPTKKIVISRWLEKLCREEFHQSCVLIPNAVDTGLFFSGPRSKQAVPTIGFLYHDLAFKGMDVALRALARIRERMPNVRVVAFGREKPTKELPLPDGAIFERRPAQERLREIYSMCDVWMCGSRAEGFHLPPLEAMACRTPVVSTKVGGPMDVVDEGVNGHLADVEDDEKLALRVIRVLSLPEREWLKMSEAAWRTAHAYTWDDATDSLEKTLTTWVEESAYPGHPTPSNPNDRDRSAPGREAAKNWKPAEGSPPKGGAKWAH